MDTALALMEAREPVYPLDIVRTMRDQRACMVQNVVSLSYLLNHDSLIYSSLLPSPLQSQYRFVCECICAAYMKISRSSAAINDEDD